MHLIRIINKTPEIINKKNNNKLFSTKPGMRSMTATLMLEPSTTRLIRAIVKSSRSDSLRDTAQF